MLVRSRGTDECRPYDGPVGMGMLVVSGGWGLEGGAAGAWFMVGVSVCSST